MDYPEDVFDRVLAINLKGVFLGLKYVLPPMVENGSGSIVNAASVGGVVGAPGSLRIRPPANTPSLD